MTLIDLTSTPLPTLPPRDSHSHKGTFGRGLIVGGSLGMAGAPALAAMACLRSGTGLTSVATPGCVQPVVAGYCPAYMTHPLADDGEQLIEAALEPLTDLVAKATATAIGPGLGQSPALETIVAELQCHATTPTVFDADGLNALATRPEMLTTPGGVRILTPHAGEFARLCGQPLNDPNDDGERRTAATALAQRDPTSQTIVLLKGPRTLLTDGKHFAINQTGNPGMATGGSGDVLTGILVALLCQDLTPFDAARLGAHVHGLAGDLAAAKLGETSLIATDIVDWLPTAWIKLCSTN